MNLPNVIGICGQAGAGKDTAAKWFVERGYTKDSFAAPIKRMLNQAFGWSMEDWECRAWKRATHAVICIDSYGHARCTSPRALAQWLGTDVVRNNFGQDAWVDLWKQRWHDAGQPRVVVADIRFQNEVDAIHKLGGTVIRVTRGPYTGRLFFHENERTDTVHDSERTGELRFVDHHIENNGTIQELYESLARSFA